MNLTSFVLLLSSFSVGCSSNGMQVSALKENPAPLRFQEYKVMFTNPICAEYLYASSAHIVDRDGNLVPGYPKNTFCTTRDREASANRDSSPQHELINWIRDPSTTEIFFTYLTFSNRDVEEELCRAARERGVKIKFILHVDSDLSLGNQLVGCTSDSFPGRAPEMELRGNEGGIGFSHNKVFMINPGAPTTRIAFSSGNLTSGVVLHHENWNFITLPSATYFAQSHLCMMNGMYEAGHSKQQYTNYMRSCRSAIAFEEETDIHAYFVPGGGGEAGNALVSEIQASDVVLIAAHRFSFSKMINALHQRLEGDPVDMRITVDDDVYWAGRGQMVGDNSAAEASKVKDLVTSGAKAKYMQTNHFEHLLHHNKFVYFAESGEVPRSVFAGAGNFTNAAFSDNFENYYLTTIPAVLESYRAQYNHLWNDLATPEDRLPTTNVRPVFPTE